MRSLEGRVCLVTGGSKGIGRGIALQLGKAGALVYVTGRSAGELETCCAEIDAAGGKGVPLTVDHSKVGLGRNEVHCRRRISIIRTETGNTALTIIISHLQCN